MTPTLSEALRLHEMGFSIIPIRPNDKKALVPWEKYQKIRAKEEQLESWFTQNPKANIGLVTGEISGVDLLDIDTLAGREKADEFLPECLDAPVCLTPNAGQHIYFEHTPGMRRTIKFIDGCDFLADGGYALIPPSIGKNGKPYIWAPGLSIYETAPAALPASLKKQLSFSFSLYKSCDSQAQNPDFKKSQESQESQKITIDFSEGRRNESLFTVAYSSIKGEMGEANTVHLLMELNKLCKPPLPEKEVERIFKSALERHRRRERNITGEVREFISVSSCEFSCEILYNAVRFVSKEERAAARQALVTLCKEGVIERVATRSGWYRPINSTIEYMDFLNASTAEFPVSLPLGLNDYIKLYPGNIFIVAGSKGGAKTSFMLNLTKLNQGKHEIVYMNSEMGNEELRIRLMGFKDVPLTSWTKNFIPLGHDWHDLIKPSENTIWIIDYMEADEGETYKVTNYIKRIHEKMGGKGLCFIGLQKKLENKWGVGGRGTADRARAYMALDYDSSQKAHKIEIIDAKAWRGPRNPRGLFRHYQIADQGARYTSMGYWQESR